RPRVPSAANAQGRAAVRAAMAATAMPGPLRVVPAPRRRRRTTRLPKPSRVPSAAVDGPAMDHPEGPAMQGLSTSEGVASPARFNRQRFPHEERENPCPSATPSVILPPLPAEVAESVDAADSK